MLSQKAFMQFPASAVALLVGCLVWCSSGHAADAPFRAGAATANITPPLGEMVVGGWEPVPADEVHDELHVRAIVLDDGDTKLAIAICDNVGIPREVFDVAKAQVEATTGIPVKNQLYAATHTHSATTARGKNSMVKDEELSGYQIFLADRIVDAVRIANKRLEPARIGWGSVEEASELFNRRWYVVEEEQRRNPFGGVDEVRMNPSSSSTLIRPAGPVDPEVSYLALQALDGRPIAILGNYSLHYVGGVPSRVVSADYFAVFAEHLGGLLETETQYPPFVGILSNGTSGDVNNINFRDRSARYAPFEKMALVGQLIARRVHESLGEVQYQDWVKLGAQQSELTLKVRKPDAEMKAYLAGVVQRPEEEKPYHRHEKTYAARTATLSESPDTVDVPLQTLRIGDLGIAAVPFEVFTEIGLEIKDRCPLSDSFTIELAGGSYGYLPSPAQHELGGYETWMGTNRVQLDASEKIVERLMSMFDAIK
ncbi:hypothetical protein [Aureliella helgolandensis]|uniref:Neutral/alkaline non-lysosomal ceramidase n=1 Tax=Aureliella helgolandensis TaxID=2527968 RepID=A0A518GHB7_9BACT|nr:hypothetical protein [Aureliella helgolandensis]QDV27991.1 Neutral/alkaline non-lysosomal ceramidase [Aureliella helgolandensis]